MAKQGLTPRHNATREIPSNEEVAQQVHIERLPIWKNAKHGVQWINQLREGIQQTAVGIWINEETDGSRWKKANDLILLRWQVNARKWDGKTIDKYLGAIREFEHMVGRRSFQEVTQEDADCYRDFLIGKAQLPKEQGGLSRSTVSKKAGQLAAFFAWMVKQPGYRRMNQMLSEYFELPRKALAKAQELAPRAYPKFSEVPPMLAAIPCNTLQTALSGPTPAD